MKDTNNKKTWLIPVLALLYCGFTHAQSDNKLRNYIDSAVDKAVLKYMQDSNANGLSIGIYKDGKKYIYNYGEIKKGSSQLPSADNFYNLGSVAKTFVETMLAEAVVENKVSLNDDIRKYLPGDYQNLQYNNHPICFVNLANHTSALPKAFHNYAPINDSLKKLPMAEQVSFYNAYTEDSLLADLHHVSPDTLPGATYQYNGNAVLLLELLLERIYHEPYEQIITHYLQTHLGMNDTKTILSTTDFKRAAQGYDNHSHPQPYLNLTGFTGGPSINSTVNDMLKYLEANISEKDKAVKLTHQLTWGKQDAFGVGLGWMMDTENGNRYIYHDGNTKLGFNTLCLFYPDKKLGYIIIANDNISQQKLGDIENDITKAIINK